MSTAILVDGAFFLKRAKKLYPNKDHNNPKVMAELLHRYAILHLSQGPQRRKNLYRIFVYDCPPFTKTLLNPVSNKQINFSKTATAQFRLDFHEKLRGKRLVALRLGHIPDHVKDWKFIHPSITKDLISGKRLVTDINEYEVVPDIRQKGVDMKIGIDIASLSLKKLVDQIILISGDSDFVPASKLARREGIDFVLDPMWNPIAPDLHEHIDGLISKAPNPRAPTPNDNNENMEQQA